PLSGGLYRRFFQGGLGLHLRSFVTTTKPQPSLIHNLKSVPLVLTGDSTKLYELIADGEVETVKLGKSTRVITASLHRLVMRQRGSE
ncbi:MAG TPA: hypothetical protein VL094_03190, partial [Sphingomonadaceae bacterium]|nr:hypothetical protein [Sphingomonadaceae bacterium]